MSAEAPASSVRSRWRRVAVVMLVALIVLTSVFVFTLQNNATNASVSSAVQDAYSKHISDFESGNLTRLTGDYVSTGTLEWTGDTRNWGGEYTSSNTIHDFYARFFSAYRTLSLSEVSYMVQPSGNGATVNGSALLIGLNISNSSMRANILMQAVYTRANGAWVISSETWSFQNFFILLPLD